MTAIDDTFQLKRAGQYATPANTGDVLPVVYGDITDGGSGNWRLPCIDTASYVHCYAAHAVLSVANGNTVAIYADGVLVSPANYTFDESDDYESAGAIATITFTADQGNAVITASGCGKASGATLIENIVDIVYDFFTVESDYTSADFNATRKAIASDRFDAAGYVAAGVIVKDQKYLDVAQSMLSSFLGTLFVDASDEIVIEIDNGVRGGVHADIIPGSDTRLLSAVKRRASLVNRCPASYAHDFSTNTFRGYDDGTATENAASQFTFGVCIPTTPFELLWCRDLTSVRAVQTIIADNYGSPVWEISIEDASLKRLHVEAGDLIAVTIEELYDASESQLINQLVKVLSIQPDFKRNKMRIGAIDTGMFMTTAHLADGDVDADGTYMAGGNRDTVRY